MTTAFEQLESEALKLSRNERIILGQELLVSALTQEETEVEKAWYDEAERRWAAYKASPETIPGEQALDDILAELES